MRYLPIHIDMKDARVVIIGGGAAAEAKLRTLVKTEAHLLVIAPQISPEIMRWAEQGVVQWQARTWTKTDLDGARLVYAASENAAENSQIATPPGEPLSNWLHFPVIVSALAATRTEMPNAHQKSLAVRTDLDRRLFARYAPRVAAAFVSGVGEALSDPGTSLIDLGGVTGVTRPAATIEQGLYKGLAQVGNDLAGEFVQSAPKGPLISLRSRQIIGILFTSNVVPPTR